MKEQERAFEKEVGLQERYTGRRRFTSFVSRVLAATVLSLAVAGEETRAEYGYNLPATEKTLKVDDLNVHIEPKLENLPAFHPLPYAPDPPMRQKARAGEVIMVHIPDLPGGIIYNHEWQMVTRTQEGCVETKHLYVITIWRFVPETGKWLLYQNGSSEPAPPGSLTHTLTQICQGNTVWVKRTPWGYELPSGERWNPAFIFETWLDNNREGQMVTEILQDERGWQRAGSSFRFTSNESVADVIIRYEAIDNQDPDYQYCRLACMKFIEQAGRQVCLVRINGSRPSYVVGRDPRAQLTVDTNHELGHCFGLAHHDQDADLASRPRSVMSGFTFIWPTEQDIAAVREKPTP